MASKAEFYQSHLDRVSRSFAFCIRQLPSPLREWIGLSYLLCRVVDTVEDAPWTSTEAQFDAFRRFDEALLSASDLGRVRDWAAVFPAGLSQAEAALLGETVELMDDYHRFPPAIRDIMKELIYSMSQGMQHFCRTRSADGALYLQTLAEVNQYCFFVAGVVGELLSKLLAKVEPRFEMSEQALLRAHHFGLFLQKVNLLKDQVGDERVGRHLIPSRELVENSAQENAVNAFEFLLSLPKEQPEFRRFCAWSLFLGLEALGVSRRSAIENKVLKVPRQRMEEIISDVEDRLLDDGALRQLFQSLSAALSWAAEATPKTESAPVPDWFLRLYLGPLEAPNLSRLGVSSI